MLGTFAKYAVLVLGAALMVLPFFWMINASFMTSGEIQAQPPVWIPSQLRIQNTPSCWTRCRLAGCTSTACS